MLKENCVACHIEIKNSVTHNRLYGNYCQPCCSTADRSKIKKTQKEKELNKIIKKMRYRDSFNWERKRTMAKIKPRKNAKI